MAITITAKNITITTKNKDVIMAGKIKESAEDIHIEATNGNINLNSQKKIIANGS
jgi:lipopolysaccharide assembly outer membrane protein LptD (OstA)